MPQDLKTQEASNPPPPCPQSCCDMNSKSPPKTGGEASWLRCWHACNAKQSQAQTASVAQPGSISTSAHTAAGSPPTLSRGGDGFGRLEAAIHPGADARTEHGGAALLGPERGAGLPRRGRCRLSLSLRDGASPLFYLRSLKLPLTGGICHARAEQWLLWPTSSDTDQGSL